MALPLLLSFLGSGLASSGALGSFLGGNALLAGALGSGLGTAIEKKDLGEGIKAGLGSYFGGKLLGSVAGSMGGDMAAKASGIPQASTGAAMNVAPPPRPANISAGPTLSGIAKNMYSQLGDPQMIGSQIGASIASPPEPPPAPRREPGPQLAPYKGTPRIRGIMPAGYRPGVDPELDYRRYTRGYAAGGTVAKVVPGYGIVRMQEGGIANLVADQEDMGQETETEISPDNGGFEVETETSRTAGGNEKTVIVDAIKAIKGMHDQPELALGAFMAKYGEDALRDLVDRVQSGEFDETLQRFQNGENGIVRGPGDGSGTDDKVPATIDGEQDVLLSDGEYVVRKDSTDALEDEFGSGFMDRMNKAGSRAPEVVKQMVA